MKINLISHITFLFLNIAVQYCSAGKVKADEGYRNIAVHEFIRGILKDTELKPLESLVSSYRDYVSILSDVLTIAADPLNNFYRGLVEPIKTLIAENKLQDDDLVLLENAGKCNEETVYTISSVSDLYDNLSELECVFAAGELPSTIPLGTYYGRLLRFANTGLYSPLVNLVYNGDFTVETYCNNEDVHLISLRSAFGPISTGVLRIGTVDLMIHPDEYFDNKKGLIFDFSVDFDELCNSKGEVIANPMLASENSNYFPVNKFIDQSRLVGRDSDNCALLLGRTFLKNREDKAITSWYFVIKSCDDNLNPKFQIGQSLEPLKSTFNYKRASVKKVLEALDVYDEVRKRLLYILVKRDLLPKEDEIMELDDIIVKDISGDSIARTTVAFEHQDMETDIKSEIGNLNFKIGADSNLEKNFEADVTSRTKKKVAQMKDDIETVEEFVNKLTDDVLNQVMLTEKVISDLEKADLLSEYLNFSPLEQLHFSESSSEFYSSDYESSEDSMDDYGDDIYQYQRDVNRLTKLLETYDKASNSYKARNLASDFEYPNLGHLFMNYNVLPEDVYDYNDYYTIKSISNVVGHCHSCSYKGRKQKCCHSGHRHKCHKNKGCHHHHHGKHRCHHHHGKQGCDHHHHHGKQGCDHHHHHGKQGCDHHHHGKQGCYHHHSIEGCNSPNLNEGPNHYHTNVQCDHHHGNSKHDSCHGHFLVSTPNAPRPKISYNQFNYPLDEAKEKFDVTKNFKRCTNLCEKNIELETDTLRLKFEVRKCSSEVIVDFNNVMDYFDYQNLQDMDIDIPEVTMEMDENKETNITDICNNMSTFLIARAGLEKLLDTAAEIM